MKKLLLIACLLAAFCLPAPIEAEEADLTPLIGTWVALDGHTRYVCKNDLTVDYYWPSTAAEPTYVNTFTVEEAWRDAEGAAWYKIVSTRQSAGVRVYHLLIRISSDCKTYEEDYIRVNLAEFPSAVDPESLFYTILFRE